MRLLSLAATLAIVALAGMRASAADPDKPRPPATAPATYSTENYDITFAVPPGASYCPLPINWVGSDHGTVLFLARPSGCYGAGYPASDRGYEPPTVPRIEVYYGYSVEEYVPPPCHGIGHVHLLGRRSALCLLGRNHGLLAIEARATYESDEPCDFGLTLEMTPARLKADLATLATMAASVRTCRPDGRHQPGSCLRNAWF